MSYVDHPQKTDVYRKKTIALYSLSLGHLNMALALRTEEPQLCPLIEALGAYCILTSAQRLNDEIDGMTQKTFQNLI